MSKTRKPTLADLRQQIDAIDVKLHDLIMQRTEVVENVRELKKGESVKIRPAREAEIVYRLMERHRGPFPRRELARIWRELIVATLSFEGPFSVAVQVPESQTGYWDMARDQYGSFTPMRRFTTSARVIEAVQRQECTLGVLPLPRNEQNDDQWWRHLVSTAEDAPRVIARLPFAGPGNGFEAQGLEALVICPMVTPEPTGRDRTYLAVECEEDVPFRAIAKALNDLGFSPVFNQLWHEPSRPAAWTYLTEVFGFVDPEKGHLENLKEAVKGRVSRVIHLGACATPLGPQELDPRKKR
ncbi:MAG: chorismate mutase [Rhodospirillales bacterium CG15_BIG_FIL_POST_REV_8_21_14_020_66_15]|nr:MAG: chorismate mutase [Rhodospirillales bacterium CG15_BIG_FIL_POST_REV_8_21_14_020_66_15]